jgi:hypothetical protein
LKRHTQAIFTGKVGDFMKKHSEQTEIAQEILSILAKEESSKKYWTKSSLYLKVCDNLQKRYNTQKVELGQRAPKVSLSKDTVVSAVDALINSGFAEIDMSMMTGTSNRLDEPVKLTFLGLLKALSSFLQQNPDEKLALLESLAAVAKLHQKEIPILFKKWGDFETQGMQEKVVERIKKYFKEDCFTKSLVLGLRASSYSQEVKRTISVIALDEFLDFIFFEPIAHPPEKEAKLWLTLIAKDDELTKFVDDQFQYHLDPLFPEKELLSSQKKLQSENSKFQADKEKTDLLFKNLGQKIKEFHKQTGYVPVFSKAFERFINEKPQTLHTVNKINEAELKEIMNLGYKAWVGLTLILMLEPTEFSILNEELELKAEKSFPFFVEKWFGHNPYDPNFAFYSSSIQAWIGFSFGMSVQYYYPPRPDIWLIKGEKLEDVKRFVNFERGGSTHVLIEPEDAKDWTQKVRLHQQYLEYNRERKTEFALMKDYIRNFVPKLLFVVCWEKKIVHFGKLDSRIRVLDGTDFDPQNLTKIVKEIKTI